MSVFNRVGMITICLLISGCNTKSISAQPVIDEADMIVRGEQIFVNQCEYCHGRGLEKGGTHRLRQRYQGAVTEYLQDRDNLTPEYIRVIIRQWSMGMAAIRPTEITDEELE
jgi:mono/diheme cytochrome c family protein